LKSDGINEYVSDDSKMIALDLAGVSSGISTCDLSGTDDGYCLSSSLCGVVG
jgi:hypothetical protein